MENEISLKPFTDDDLEIFIKWLDQPYIYQWFCEDGEEEKTAWLAEIRGRHNEYHYMEHFIVYHNEKKIGFCLYLDLYFEPDYVEEREYEIDRAKNAAYEIAYFIGEKDFLQKGIGTIIVKKLEEKIMAVGGKDIFADPDEANIPSINTLLKNGFVKVKNGIYRKSIVGG